MTAAHSSWRRRGQESEGYNDARRRYVLGRQVYERRIALGFSQADLAERAGMTQPQVSRLEAGGTTPTIPLLERLAEALDADLVVAFAPHAAFSPHAV